MSVRNQNWYNLQSTRRYPVSDQSTGVSDTSEFIRDSILVDCHLRYPETLGQYVYVQGITCSGGLVTIVFGVADSLDATNGATIAAVSLPRPVVQNVHHAVKALVPGVAGWVVFGGGVNEQFVGRYSTPRQTQLLARCARGYRALPIPSLGKLGVSTSLQGIVTLIGQAPITITQETVRADGKDVPALVFRLDTANAENNPLQAYLGECGQRPESNTCPKPPIETINGVAPDCNGNINFVFEGFDAYPYANCGGIDIISSIGLSEACNQGVTRRHRSPVDNCGNEDYNPLDNLQPDVFSSESLPDLNLPSTCLTLPACFDFGDNGGSYFAVLTGLFVFERTQAPPTACVGGETSLARMTYAAANIAGQNLAILQNCASDWAREHRFVTRMKITADGLQRNGGLFFNYTQTLTNGQVTKTYFVALLDASSAALKLLRWNGSNFIVEHSTPMTIQIGEWYDLDLRLDGTGVGTTITAIGAPVSLMAPPASFSISVPAATYGSPVGQVGFFSNQSYTYFNSLLIHYLPID